MARFDPESAVGTPLERAVIDAASEFLRSLELCAAGRFEHSIDSDGLNDGQRLAVLMEEVGEVATEVLGPLVQDSTPGHLRKELVQVAAMALGWITYLDRRQ